MNKDVITENITTTFSELKSKRRNPDRACASISADLKRLFRNDFGREMDFIVNIGDKNVAHEFFGMCVYPSMEDMNEVIDAIFETQSNGKVHDKWSSINSWIIEIDPLLLYDTRLNANPSEMTAVLLHELGHIIGTESVPRVFTKTLRSEMLKLNSKTRSLVKTRRLRVAFIPGLIEACSTKIYKYTGRKEEMAADKFAISKGYAEDLNSMIDKIVRTYSSRPLTNTEREMSNDVRCVLEWSIDAIDDLKFRKNKLKSSLNLQATRTPCQFIKDTMNKIKHVFFGDDEENTDMFKIDLVESFAFRQFNKISSEKVAMDQYDKDVEESMKSLCESLFGGKKLKKIDPLDLDYIDVEIDRILTDEDKIYVLDLIYYQNELCDAVLDFINNGKCSKVCNTKSEVLEFKKRLTDMRKRTVNTKIARKNPLEFHIKVDYPKGFEG